MTQVRVTPEQLPATVAAALRDGAIVAEAPVAVLELAGNGAVTAFQGLLTNDIEAPGDGAFIYGALLTPKGMVIVDGWAGRTGSKVSFAVALPARERTLELLRRFVPPRLARVSDHTGVQGVLRLAGPRALSIAQAAGIPLPEGPGRVTTATTPGVIHVAQPGDAGPPPFALQLTGAPAELDGLARRLTAAGARVADHAALELARILSGWPSSDSEVDDKTLPQEIRFDDVAGVSYTKGCYTGQETVSRLHFRGHANRILRGLLFDGEPEPARDDGVQYQDRVVGSVTSVAWLPQASNNHGRWIGLAVLRREVTPGAVVRAGGTDARVVELPFAPPSAVPA